MTCVLLFKPTSPQPSVFSLHSTPSPTSHHHHSNNPHSSHSSLTHNPLHTYFSQLLHTVTHPHTCLPRSPLPPPLLQDGVPHQVHEAPLGPTLEGEEEGEVLDVDELYQWTQGLSFEEFDSTSYATPTTQGALLDSDTSQLSHY